MPIVYKCMHQEKEQFAMIVALNISEAVSLYAAHFGNEPKEVHTCDDYYDKIIVSKNI